MSDGGDERFVRALDDASEGRIRIPLRDVRRAYVAAFPAMAGDVEARADLAARLDALASRGAFALPSRTGTSWDRSALPHLPSFVQRAAPAASDRDDPSLEAWPPELSFVVRDAVRRSIPELRAIRAFLRDDGALRPLVPVRERSLELFGDEKRLDALRDSSLFGAGRLTLAMLRCHEIVPPLAFEAGPSGPIGRPMLVIENLHTWESFRRWNGSRGAYAAIVFGHGNQVRASGACLLEIREATRGGDVHYFGDLDETGVAIAAGVDADLRAASGIGIAPAERWYARLLDFEPRASKRESGARQADEAALAWLPESVRARVRAMFGRGERLPQEWVGAEVLQREWAVGSTE